MSWFADLSREHPALVSILPQPGQAYVFPSSCRPVLDLGLRIPSSSVISSPLAWLDSPPSSVVVADTRLSQRLRYGDSSAAVLLHTVHEAHALSLGRLVLYPLLRPGMPVT